MHDSDYRWVQVDLVEFSVTTVCAGQTIQTDSISICYMLYLHQLLKRLMLAEKFLINGNITVYPDGGPGAA